MPDKLITPSFALLRSPLLPIDQLLNQFKQTEQSPDEQLRQWLNHPDVERALFVASPALYDVWKGWQQNPDQLPLLPARLALWRYVIRMSSRSTPFGLFAGVSTAFLANKTTGEVADNDFTSITRPDSAWLLALSEKLVQDPTIRWYLRYRPNNSLYAIGDQTQSHSIRYSDYTVDNGQRAFFINSVEADPAVRTVLDYANSSPTGKTGNELIGFLQVSLGETEQQATTLVDELIEAHLLVSELEPGVTGDTPFDQLLSRLRRIPEATSILIPLAEISSRSNTPFESVATDQLTEAMMQMIAGNICVAGSVRQIDMVRQSESVSIRSQTIEQIGREIMQLSALRADRKPAALVSFAQRFYARYGVQMQPLLLALDHETSIGYDVGVHRTSHSSLLQQLTADDPQPKSTPTPDRLDTLRLAKLTAYLQTGQRVQQITDAELTEAAGTASTTPLARSWAVLGELYRIDAREIDQGHYQFLVKSVAGPSGASLMARFCQHDDGLRQQIQRLIDREAEQYPNAILAEIAHLPAGRMGNVLNRPRLRQYEIPYITPSSVDEEHTLLLSDLWVRVPDGVTVELWSKKNNKRVLPRNTTAHNYYHSDDVYRFLSDLAHQDEAFSFSWSWGMIANQPTLPRLEYNHIIVARAQWNLTKQKDWLLAGDMVTDIQQRLAVPDLIALVDGDNELLLDLTADPCRQILYAELMKRKTVRVVEWLATTDRCWLSRKGQRYASELVIPFGISRPSPLPQPSPFTTATDSTVQRSFLPGSEWLYIKVYVGEQTANELLTQVVGRLVEKAFDNEWIDQWFFVRYYDPEHHLRLRFHCLRNSYSAILMELNGMLTPWKKAGQVHAMQVDTYERELERYGYSTMPLCEQLFWADSEWNLQWIGNDAELGEDEQWWIACQRADQMMTCFGLTLTQKQELTVILQERFLRENKENTAVRKELNSQYRTWEIRMKGHSTKPPVLSTETLLLIESIRVTLATSNAGLPTVTDLLKALLHMQFNRFFISSQRLSEGVVYHFLARQYTSQLGKQRTVMSLETA